MSAYPSSDQDRRVAAEPLRRFVSDVFGRCGMSATDAALLADTLVTADLRGVHSHGVLRVPEYAKKLTGGGVDPNGKPRVARDSGAALLVDGGNSMGQIAANFAMRQALERAKSTQVALVSVGGSNHCGAMAYYATQALPEDMIGLASTNALPTMAPWGRARQDPGHEPPGRGHPRRQRASYRLRRCVRGFGARQDPRVRPERTPDSRPLGFRFAGTADNGRGSRRRRTDSTNRGVQGNRLGAGHGYPHSRAFGRGLWYGAWKLERRGETGAGRTSVHRDSDRGFRG